MFRSKTFAVAAAVLAPSAAAQTGINAPSLFERSQAEILSDAFGGSFVQSGNDFVSGDLQALRVSDSLDQIWQAGTYDVSILARESLFNTKFGYVGGDGDFERILRTTSGPDSATVTIGEDFAWAVKNAALLGGNVYTSQDDDNRDGEDHMVTYSLLDGDNRLGFVLFFEDWGGHLSDHDFNDLAVFVSLVPAPHAALLGALGLGGLALGASRRR